MIAAAKPSRSGAAARIIFIVMSLLVFAALLALGTWQVKRLQWKEALIASIAARTAAPASTIADMEQRLAGTGDVDYWPVRVSGVFEHANEQHFFATHKGLTGYYVYTPLRLADGRALFVNRGIVPFDQKEAAVRLDGQLAGTVTVTGLARNRLDRKPSWVVPDNDPGKNIYYWKDLTAMARSSGYDIQTEIVPLFVDADDTPNPGGLPVGGVTIIELPNNHLQYAITWYGLAAALAGVFGFWYLRQHTSAGKGEDA
ncbi:MAG: SURF1 family protein [Rhizobiaceae bacterium]